MGVRVFLTFRTVHFGKADSPNLKSGGSIDVMEKMDEKCGYG